MTALLETFSLPALEDNYIHLILNKDTRQMVAVDPASAGPVLEFLETTGYRLTHILNTHHHWDHVGGNLELKQRTGCRILAGQRDGSRVPGVDELLSDEQLFPALGATMQILEIPGHTLGHIAFLFVENHWLFCGDTLFTYGCGKLFEGTPAQMLTSLTRLSALPDTTLVYCGHEYTEANLAFALSLEPENLFLKQKFADTRSRRAKKLPTVPGVLGDEKKGNPFLRTQEASLKKSLRLETSGPVKVFTELRRRKDVFSYQPK